MNRIVCDFCRRRITNPDESIIVFKGTETLTTFEAATGLKHLTSHRDKNDGETAYVACGRCATKYLEKQTQTSQQSLGCDSENHAEKARS